MHVEQFHDPEPFAAAVTSCLLRHEAENNFFLGMMGQWERYPDRLLCAVRDNDEVVAVATMMRPWHMLTTRCGSDVAEALVDFLHGEKIVVPGIQGDATAAESFARRWLRLHLGARRREGKGLGIYKLERVIAPAGVSGACRVATEEDLDLLVAWRDAFIRDVGEPARDGGTEEALNGIRAGKRFLWCDPQPVCMVSVAGATPNGIRINAVYTPPEHRRRGYASACTAVVSQRMLDDGRRFCFLYTDLANPTSNKIYREIGYKHVCDQVQVFFDPPETA